MDMEPFVERNNYLRIHTDSVTMNTHNIKYVTSNVLLYQLPSPSLERKVFLPRQLFMLSELSYIVSLESVSFQWATQTTTDSIYSTAICCVLNSKGRNIFVQKYVFERNLRISIDRKLLALSEKVQVWWLEWYTCSKCHLYNSR